MKSKRSTTRTCRNETAAAAANFGTLWAPNYYTLLETVDGSEVLCSGQDAGVTVPGGMIVRKAYVDANGATVAKVLAAWLRAVGYVQNEDNHQATLDYMAAFYALDNVSISRDAMETEMDTRPMFGLSEQLQLLARNGDDGRTSASTVDTWFTDAANFLVNNSVTKGHGH